MAGVSRSRPAEGWLSPRKNYFELLTVPVAVEPDALTRRYRELSRQFHPDRFVNADPATQAAALDSSALLNDAYRVLRDPFTRAEYLLKQTRDTRAPELPAEPKPPQDLFAAVLELQEVLVEYQEARTHAQSATCLRLRPELERARQEFDATYTALQARLQDDFLRYDRGERLAALEGMAQVVGIRGYLRRILTQLEKALG